MRIRAIYVKRVFYVLRGVYALQIHYLKRMIKSKFNTSSYREEIKTRGYSYPTMTSGSRGAINLRNRKTIELRFMGGSLQEKYYKSKVDYIQAVYEYTFNSSFSSQNIREFVRYIKRNKNSFKNLHDVLDSKTYKRAIQFPREIPSNLNY